MTETQTYNNKTGLLVSLVVLVLMSGMSLYGWMHLPDNAKVPMHWGLNGEVNRYGGKTEAMLALPATALLMSALFNFVPRFQPHKARLLGSMQAAFAAWLTSMLVLLILHAFITVNALQFQKTLAR